MTPRLDELREPVVVGQFYLVPTVSAYWYDKYDAWPVIGPKHNDSQCLNFGEQHFHLDARFLAVAEDEDDEWFWRSAFAAPVTTNKRLNPNGLPAPEWRRRKCRREANPFLTDMRALAARHETWQCHFAQWKGKQARRDERGWVCPHRSVPLADQPSINGVITCPLHLLRIDATNGRVLPQEAAL